ncbi:MAG: hypothetical protein JWM57_237, partial [Phycisphaerales bacterium]|nr:hypothetical protein [Phycisphaerales bacterium]
MEERFWAGIARPLAAGVVAALAGAGAIAQSTPTPVNVPGFALPYSIYNPPETVTLFERMRRQAPLPPNAPIVEARKFYGAQNEDRVKRMR